MAIVIALNLKHNLKQNLNRTLDLGLNKFKLFKLNLKAQSQRQSAI
jgi:hypothetical protein